MYALSSGMALGLVNLGANKSEAMGDFNIDERLIRYIEGGKLLEMPKSTQ